MSFNRLFIAEKPALGAVIAEALGGAVRHDGYIQCGNDAVTWCVGHVLELAPPEEHDPAYAKWNLSDLPLKMRPHKLRPKQTTEKQFNVIKRLISQSQVLAHAGDCDDEGQLLIDEVISYCNAKQPVMRVLINDLNISAAKKALENMKNNSEFYGLSQKALARSIGDQLYGFNMTRAYTLAAQAKNGGKQVLSVGRVQTPILGLIVTRYLANKDHKASYFYSINGHFDFSGAHIKARYVPPENAPVDDKNRICDEVFADWIIVRCKGQAATIKTHTIEDKQTLAPLPFALLDLQAAMSKKYGLSAQATLDITQSLREKHKAITYNRSDCNYLSSDQFADAAQTLTMLEGLFPNLSNLNIDKSQKGRAFNDANVSAHTAIIPTTTQPNISNMTPDETKVYQAIVDQYVAQFLPARTYKQCKVELTVLDHQFSTTATQITDPGWSSLLGNAADEEGEGAESDDSPYNALAALQSNDHGVCECITVSKEKTKPLPLYTEATLLKDLQRVAKYVKDPKIKQLLKDKDAGKKGESGGIGTPATRASMLETLKRRGFYIEKNKKLEPTPLGIEFYQALPEIATNPDMTALWHEQQTSIERGEMTVDQFLDDLESFIANQIRQIDVGSINAIPTQMVGKDTVVLKCSCPDCSGELSATTKFIYCKNCTFRFFRTICGKSLTENQINYLFMNKKTPVIKGFISKQEKKFNAALILESGGKVKFDFSK